MKIFYQNNYNQKINLMEWPYMIADGGDLLDYEWKYDSTYNSGSFGGKITEFTRNIEKHSIGIAIAANTKDLFTSALDHLLEVTEKDILGLTPGRLYVDDYYMTCYIYGDKKTKWEMLLELMEGSISIVSPYPVWCKETKYTFSKNRETTSTDGDYPYGYPYDYPSMFEEDNVINTHYAASNFKMTIYGPCETPSVFIGGNLYQVNTSVLTGEYVAIDSREGTITLVKQNGIKENVFHSRNKEYDIFKAIPTGTNALIWDGEFWFDLVIITERSVPQWIL